MSEKPERAMLEIIGFSEAEIIETMKVLVPYTSLLRYTRLTVYEAFEGKIGPARSLEVLALRDCYAEWKEKQKLKIGDKTAFHDVFNGDYWEEWKDTKVFEIPERHDDMFPKLAPTPAPIHGTTRSQTHATTETDGDTAEPSTTMASYKVDAKDLPKLPKNKELRGEVFDTFKSMFDIQMDRAGCADIVDLDTPVPDPTDESFKAWDRRDKWVRFALLNAAIGTDAWSSVTETETGREIYHALLYDYQYDDVVDVTYFPNDDFDLPTAEENYENTSFF